MKLISNYLLYILNIFIFFTGLAIIAVAVALPGERFKVSIIFHLFSSDIFSVKLKRLLVDTTIFVGWADWD